MTPAVWMPEHDAMLVWCLEIKGLSRSEAATAINKAFGTCYTRNAVIGHAKRKGIAPRQVGKPKMVKVPKPAKPRKVAAPNPLKDAPTPYVDDPPYPGSVSLLDLAQNGCRFPTGASPFVFCNRPQSDGSSYCAGHTRLAWAPSRKQRREWQSQPSYNRVR